MAIWFAFAVCLALTDANGWQDFHESGRSSVSGLTVKDLIAQSDVLIQSALNAQRYGDAATSKSLMAEAKHRLELANTFQALHIDATAEDSSASGVRLHPFTLIMSVCASASIALLAIIAQHAIKYMRTSNLEPSGLDAQLRSDIEPVL